MAAIRKGRMEPSVDLGAWNSASISQKAIAFFKDGKSFVSLLNNGELEVAPAVAA